MSASTPLCPLLTPSVEFHLALTEKTRQRMLDLIAGLSPDQLRRIPPGFRNHLLWNLGHALVSQQLLCYEKCGQALRIPVYLPPLFRKGTHPGQWTGQVDADEIISWLRETPRLLRTDIDQGRLGEFAGYDTSMGLRLTNLSDTLTYSTWHEGQHLGIMLALRKLV